ncbi:SIR2 family protein [Thermosipho ferrireducens]|uniref:SIR2 family protein n=1 Tax=Thermosipho ferrireducens TaxID=2571116 RepID=A0ABX7SAN2_9BACT|nr:SIR2 family protein [Thermosipho ferrireducens]QTA38506.1 SIR2 family protein [Thermosipho ferrireducens]
MGFDTLKSTESIFYYNQAKKEFISLKNEEDSSNKLNEFIFKTEDNLVILAGAGCSIISKKYAKRLSDVKSGKTMKELYISTVCQIGKKKLDNCNLEKIFFPKDCPGKYDEENKECVSCYRLEEKLSLADEYIKVNEALGNEQVVEKLKNFIKQVRQKIKEECELEYHRNYFKHGEFLSKILSLRSKKNERLKIFTTNYDTLFEQAASDEKIILIDGFSYAEPRYFDDSYFDYDFVVRDNVRKLAEPILADKVIHLYKLHGSIDWVRDKDKKIKKLRFKVVKNGKIQSGVDGEEVQFVMIYPATTKFEQTFSSPHFELYSRFISELKKKNTVLIVIGFSFGDEHINNAIINALKLNNSLKMVMVDISIFGEGQNESSKSGEVESSKEPENYNKKLDELRVEYKFIQNFNETILSRILLVEKSFSEFVDLLYGNYERENEF